MGFRVDREEPRALPALQAMRDADAWARIDAALRAVPHLHDDAVYDTVVAGLGLTGMANLAPYVLGDAIAARVGAEPVGLPTGAGYAVGNRLVDAYLAATGRSVHDLVLADAAEVRVATGGPVAP